jgi:hypothetical protein
MQGHVNANQQMPMNKQTERDKAKAKAKGFGAGLYSPRMGTFSFSLLFPPHSKCFWVWTLKSLMPQ